MTLTPGTRLGSYEITSLLGSGGMGQVYRARDLKLGRDVAIKVLREELASDPERLRRFEQEARSASALNHPNIITIHDIGKHGSTPFIAMEYVEGRTLREMLSEGPLPTKKLLELATQIAEGLAKAHSAGIVHRDLKPENLMVTDDGYVKILDFGLAKLRTPPSSTDSEAVTATKEGTVLGTVGYMSPEQAKGQSADHRSDQFSLGAVLYEMATGRRAFQRESSVQTLSAIIEQEPESIAALNPSTPSHLRLIVERCLAKNPEERYDSTRDLARDLKSVEDVPSEAPVAPFRPTPERQIVPVEGEDKVSISRQGDRLSIRVEEGDERVHLEVPVRQSLLPVAGILVAVLALLVGLNVCGLRDRLLAGMNPPRIESLAVLPLENLSGDPEQEYLADGMTEALIADLAKIGSLKVISRTSTMRYKGTQKPLPEIARELNVDAVIEGSILRAGNRVRITAQLIQAATDENLWAESYERDLSDILALQGEVARAIAGEIEVELTPREEARLASARSVDPEAHASYLRGRYFWNKRTEEGIKEAIEHLQQAIEIDPAYALGYAGLADAYIALGGNLLVPPRDVFPKAEAAAKRALEIDDTLAEAHTSLAFVRTWYLWDWSGAEQEFEHAFEINPGYATAHHWYAWQKVVLGRLDDSVAVAKRAQELDPLSAVIAVESGLFLYWAGRSEQAVEQLQKVLELEPNFWMAYHYLGFAYLEMELYDVAITAFQKALALAGPQPAILAMIGHAYAVSGDRCEALKILLELKAMSEQRYVPAYYLGMLYAGLAETDETFRWMEKAYEERSGFVTTYRFEPLLAGLRSDPRFQDLVRRMNFPE